MSKQRVKVGFVFSTKDRVEFTLQSLRSIDTEGGFDLVWVDGSDTPEGKALPKKVKLSNCCLAEVHYDIRGGPDNAIRFGLQRLLELGYDYCGLIENDIEFKPGWFMKLMELFSLAEGDGLNVGAVTVRTIPTWILMYKPQYVLMWNIGAGMVLFKREAVKIVLDTYGPTSMYELRKFYLKKFDIDIARPYLGRLGIDLQRIWQVSTSSPVPWSPTLGCDFAYAMRLYERNFASIGSITPMSYNIDLHSHLMHYGPSFYLVHPLRLVASLSRRIKRGLKFYLGGKRR